jgi:endonuclease YncB( thermonuclease family)
MNIRILLSILLFAGLLILSIAAVPTAIAEIWGSAIVKEDASLRVRGHRVRLFGIHIPSINRFCGNAVYPISCEAQSASRLLNRMISGSVHCYERWENADGSFTAVCWNDDNDLGAYLIGHGWALATPDAPFEYHALERVARYQRRGLWAYYGYGDY